MTERIFKGLMRDFHLESKEDGATVGMSPESLFHFYIEGVESGSLPAPMTSIDLKKAKDFIQKPISEKQLFNVIQKVRNKIFKGGIVLPEIVYFDADKNKKEAYRWTLRDDEPIFTKADLEKEELGERPRGRKTVKHYQYSMLLTHLGIYLILTASSHYNIEFLPKVLYRLNDSCNDFYRSIVGWWYLGYKKLSYSEVRERMGIRQETNPSIERQYIERNLDYLKDKNIIEDWERIVKGNEKYIKNEEITYGIIFDSKRYKAYKRKYAKKKIITRYWDDELQLENEEENEDKSL